MTLGLRARLFLLSLGLMALGSLAAYGCLDLRLTDRARTSAEDRSFVPMLAVEDALAEARTVFLAATLFGVVGAWALSALAVRWAVRASSSLVETARAVVSGGTSESSPPGDPAFAELGHALDHLAGSHLSTLGDLRRQGERMGRILNGMQEGVLLLDEQGRIAFVNPALRHMLLLGADAVGRAPSQVLHNAELEDLLLSAREQAAPVRREIDLGGLKPRRLEVRVAPLPGELGTVFAMFVDVTEMRRLEGVRRDFVANVSHELRTPVTAIRSAAETLTTAIQTDPGAVPMFVEIIDRNAERLHGLVEDLLDLSRIESRELKLKLEFLDLSEIFSQVIGLFAERADKKGIALRSDLEEGFPPAVADRRALEHVLSNLVDNAVKYCGSGSTVRLSADRGDAAVRVLVADNGAGIEPKHLARLFERFYRVDTGRSRELGGTGLGLALVKHLVEAMGGKVGVESAPKVGTTFFFTLPRRDPARS